MNELRDFKKHPPEMHLVEVCWTSYADLTLVCPDSGRPASAFVKGVFEVVVVDLMVRTYICSATPSVYYMHVYGKVEFFDDATDEEIGWADDEYSTDCGEGHGYFDWREISDQVEADDGTTYAIETLPEELEAAIEEAAEKKQDPGLVLLEMQREWYQGNHVL